MIGSLSKEYDAAICSRKVKAWFIISFMNLYVSLALILYMYETKNKRLKYYTYVFLLFLGMPWLLAYTIAGNFMMQTVDSD